MSSKTIMGFPSLTAALDQAEETHPPDVGSRTLFGFPAQKSADAEPQQDDFEEDENDATTVIPASDFQFDSFAADDPDYAAPGFEADLRGTIAGMVADTATDASGTALFPGMRVAADEEREQERTTQGTLMGMTLSELAAHAPPAGDNSRSTQFAIPAVQNEAAPELPPAPALPSASTTQAWRPGLIEEEQAPDPRAALLQKLRKSRPELPPLTPTSEGNDDLLERLRGKSTSDTAKLPAAAAAAAIEAAGGQRQSSTPSAGILRPANRPRTSVESLEDISDPDFGLMETGIVSGEELRQSIVDAAGAERAAAEHAAQQEAPPLAEPEPPDEPTPYVPTPTLQHTPVPFQQQDRPGPTPHYVPFQQQAQPAQPQATPLPQQPQPQQPQQPQTPGHAQPHAAPVADPNARPHYATPNPAPHAPMATSASNATPEDEMVTKIQSVLALGSGIVALIAVVATLIFGGFPGVAHAIFILFAGVLGLGAILAARLPIPSNVRQIALLALAAMMFGTSMVGLVISLSGWFFLLCLASLIGFIAGAFPLFAKLLG